MHSLEKKREKQGSAASEWIAKRRWQWAGPAGQHGRTWPKRHETAGTVAQKNARTNRKGTKTDTKRKTIVVSQFEWDSGYARQVCLWKPGSNSRRLRAKTWRQFFNCLPGDFGNHGGRRHRRRWLLFLLFFVIFFCQPMPHCSHNRQWKAPQHCKLHIKICIRLRLVNCAHREGGI